MADDSVFGIPSSWFGIGSAGLGGAADIYAWMRNEQARRQQQRLYDILSNPQKLAAYTQKLSTPMSADAVAAVNRDLGANWAVQTGGAPGGAMNQYTADAFAKIETQRQQDFLNQAIASLTRAGGNVQDKMPLGNLGNIMRALQILQKIRPQQPPADPGITAPVPGGPGYLGGSESFRDRGPFQAPETVAAGTYEGAS